MTNWKLKQFNECAQLQKNTYKPNKTENLPYVGLEYIAQDRLNLLGIGTSSETISNKFIFHKGDILFGKLRPYFRKVVCPDFDGVCSTDIFVVGAKPGTDQKFLFYWMASHEFVNYADVCSTGTKMSRADWDFLGTIKQKIPEIGEQSKISNILWNLDKSIKNFQKQSIILEQIGNMIFKLWFVDFEFPDDDDGVSYKSNDGKMVYDEKIRKKIPEGWCVDSLYGSHYL